MPGGNGALIGAGLGGLAGRSKGRSKGALIGTAAVSWGSVSVPNEQAICRSIIVRPCRRSSIVPAVFVIERIG